MKVRKIMFSSKIAEFLLIVSTLKVLFSLGTELTPSNATVVENGNITLTCTLFSTSLNISRWTTSERPSQYAFINVVEHNKCTATNFLLDNPLLYDWKCKGNNSHSVTLINVTAEQHGVTWQCSNVTQSVLRKSVIYVIVPVKTIQMTEPNTNKLTQKENTNITLVCKTSPSRPGQNFVWLINKNATDVPADIILQDGISVKSNITRNGLISIESKLFYMLERSKNGWSIRCEMENIIGERVSSENILLNITYPPNGPLKIENFNNGSIYKIIEHHRAYLSCSIDKGNPLPALSWNCNSYKTNLFVNQSIVTKNVEWHAKRNQNSKCVCKSKYNGWVSAVFVNIDILYPPSTPTMTLKYTEHGTVVNISNNISVIENTSIKLVCSTRSNPNASYTWSGESASSSSNELEIIVKGKHKRNITCHVQNTMTPSFESKKTEGNSTTINLDVLYLPSIGNFTNTSAVEGDMFRIKCPVIPGNPPHTSYRWTKKLENETYEVSNTEDLFISKVSRKNASEYTCTVNNTMNPTGCNETKGTSKKRFFFDVMYKAVVTDFFIKGNLGRNETVVDENDTIQLTCYVVSNPRSVVSIIFGDIILNRTSNTNNVTCIKRITSCRQQGLYSCNGSNTYNNGMQSKKDLILLVRCRPSPAKKVTDNVTSAKYQSATLHFTAEAYPEPGPNGFIWKRLINSAWITLDEENHKYSIKSLELQSNLTIHNVTDSDFGQYKLLINNSVGSYEQLYKISEEQQTAAKEIFGETSKNIVFIVVGVVCGVIVIIALVVGTYLIRRRNGTLTEKVIYQNVISNDKHLKMKRKAKTKHEEEKPFEELQELDDVPQFTNEPAEYSNSPEIIERINRIKVDELFSYVSEKSEDSFGVHYQKLPSGLQKPCTFARKPEKIALNRYNGIYPYDHSRVKLPGHPDFFINACYIDGYKRCNAYIASLGPTAKTTGDFINFWQMIWHERSDIIVMLTNLREPSGMKCEQYWPKDGYRNFYGDFSVSSQKTEVFAEYTVRTFSVLKDEERRNVTHLHYTAWPDKKVPEDTTSLLEFRERMKRTHTLLEGPIVVHCSAGIGRTGTLIAIDRLIAEGQDVGSVDVFVCVTSMREQRVKMVQTLEQYVYIYKALANALTFDRETISVENIQGFVATTNSKFYNKQFQQLKQSVEADSKEVLEERVVNERLTNKNREGADIPDDRFRVMLHLSREENDSDYINAVYLNSFKKRDYFITAQTPLPNTVADFICMVYQNECTCIVTMDDFKEPGMMIGEYLPKEKNTLSFGQFTVFSSILETKHQYVVRKMKIKYSGKFVSGEKVVYHFQYTKWMQKNETPANAGDFVQFVKEVEDYASELGDERSQVLVHCLKANERSGLFCAVKILMEKIKFERHISVLSTLRHLRTRRRSAITSTDQLRFCYQAVSAFVKLYRL